jgi:hypothetical protein
MSRKAHEKVHPSVGFYHKHAFTDNFRFRLIMDMVVLALVLNFHGEAGSADDKSDHVGPDENSTCAT